MGSLHDIMMQALLMERLQFIELLVMNGFVMRKFLTVERMRQLYNDAVRQLDIRSKSKAKIAFLFIFFLGLKVQRASTSDEIHDRFYWGLISPQDYSQITGILSKRS